VRAGAGGGMGTFFGRRAWPGARPEGEGGHGRRRRLRSPARKAHGLTTALQPAAARVLTARGSLSSQRAAPDELWRSFGSRALLRGRNVNAWNWSPTEPVAADREKCSGHSAAVRVRPMGLEATSVSQPQGA